MSSVTGMLNWMGICITSIRFRAGLKVLIFPMFLESRLMRRTGTRSQHRYLAIPQPASTIYCILCTFVSVISVHVTYQPYRLSTPSWTIVIILFADWPVFLKGNWDHAQFITNYLPVPVFLMYVIYPILSLLTALILPRSVCTLATNSARGLALFQVRLSFSLHLFPSFISFHPPPSLGDGLRHLRQFGPVVTTFMSFHVSYGTSSRLFT